ncbi:MAG: hypothetical protein JNK45_33630 [Myxococcales bacterium]|nr:hypothetical protein [Myxococcales bacterium]
MSPHSSRISPWLFVFASSLVACRPAGGSRAPESKLRIEQPFPALAQLEAIAKEPAASADTGNPVRGVEAWTATGPLPTAAATTPGQSAEAKALAALFDPGERAVTQEMSCFAREAGAFMLKHGAQPSVDLAAWMGARCGVGHPNPMIAVWNRGPTGAKVFDAQRDRERILGGLKVVEGPADFGVAVVDDGTTAMSFVAVALRRAEFERVEMIPESGHVSIRGRAPGPVGSVLGYITQGEHGVARCAPAPAPDAGANAFGMSCPVDPKDAGAAIEVMVAPQGSLLADQSLSLWVSPDGSMSDAWTARRVAVPVGGDEPDALAWLTAINTIREQRDLAPWTHADAQSTLVGGLLPHIITRGTPPERRNQIALGMLAGWKVQGSIRNGTFGLSAVPRDIPLDRALGAAMASPAFRAIATTPDTNTAAIALHRSAATNLAHIAVVGYALFTARDYFAEEEWFLDQLDADRAARGLPPVERVGGPKDRAVLDAAATRVREGESNPEEELDVLLQHFATATGQQVRGMVYTTLTLDGYRPPFEGPLASATGVVAIVKIADWHPKGSAWGQHVIYVVYAVPGEG